MAADFQTLLLKGLAADLVTASLGTWSETVAYTSGQTGITLRDMPQTPDRIICLSAYGVSDDPSLSDSVLGVQVRCRWGGEDPCPADDLADLIFKRWHGMRAVTLSTGVFIVQCLRNSGPASLGKDDNQRWENSQNFYLTVHRPSTNRT